MSTSNTSTKEATYKQQLIELEKKRLLTSDLKQIEKISHKINNIKHKLVNLRIASLGKYTITESILPTSLETANISPANHIFLSSLGDILLEQIASEAGIRTFVLDGTAQLLASPQYKGWTDTDIEIHHTNSSWELPKKLRLARDKQYKNLEVSKFTNNPSFRLNSFEKTKKGPSKLILNLSPITFFEYYSVYKLLHLPFLIDSSSTQTVMEKYGSEAMQLAKSEDKKKKPLPNIINLQCILVTNDNKIVLNRRSETVGFLPSHWSASFEETMEKNDHSLIEAVTRGVYEEFGDIVRDSIHDARILSINFEYHSMAIAPLCLVRIDKSFEEIKKLREFAKDRWEASAIDYLDLNLNALDALVSNRLWHPSSRKRVLECLFNQFGIEETVRGYYKAFASV